MKFLFQISLLALVLGCTSSQTGSDSVWTTDSTEAINAIAPAIDSLMTDSLAYVGFIDRFDNNGDFYTDLYFAENFVDDNYDRLALLADEVVFESSELNRKKMTLAEARPYFNFTGLSRINIFDSHNQIIATGKFKQVEFVTDMVESKFVAVFEVSNSKISDYQYCIGSEIKRFDRLSYMPVENQKLDATLVNYLQLNKDRVWNIHHYEVEDGGVLYSSVSADTTAYVVESVDQRKNTLYKSHSTEMIYSLTILPKYIGGKPVLLARCSVPETDMAWTSLLVFIGDRYQVSTDHRLRD